jgi:hypothetical protein
MQFFRALCITSALAAAALSVHAEQLTTLVRVNIPYSITAGSQQLPPGEYTIREISAVGHIFGLFNGDGTKLETFLPAIPMDEPTTAQKTDLTFRTEGNEHILEQLRISGMNVGYQFVTPESVKSRLTEH